MPTIQELLTAVQSAAAAHASAAQMKLTTNAALAAAQANDANASTALMTALANGNQQQIQQAAQMKLQTTAALAGAQAADSNASAALVGAQVNLAAAQAALNAAIVGLLGGAGGQSVKRKPARKPKKA